MHRRLLIAACAAGLILPVIASSTAAGAAEPGSDLLTLSGTVSQVVVDPLPGRGGAEHTETIVRVAGRALDVPDAMGAKLRSGQPVTVRMRVPSGTRGSRAVEAADRGRASVLAVGVAGATASAVPAAGAHTLTILPVYWSAPDSATEASLAGLAVDTAAYWADQSNNQITIGTAVKSWKKITDPGRCDYTMLLNAALAANGRSAPVSARDHVMVYFPRRADCSWAGLGSVNGPNIWVNGYPMLDVTAHEFGHNLGLGHANTATCTSGATRVSLSGSCTITAYGDGADVMGSARYAATGNLNTALADHLGLSTTVTATAGSPTTVDLSPLADTTATRSVRVDTSTGPVFIDFRPAVGRDVRRSAWAGVQVHRRTETNPPTSQLLDMQPTLAAAFTNPSLPPSALWRVPGSDLAVKVTQVSGTARVEVLPTTVSPPVLTYPVSGSAVNATRITATWAPATSNLVVTGYRLTVNGVMAKTPLPADSTSALVALRSGTNTLAVSAVTENGLTASTPVTVAVDTTAPVAPTKASISSTNALTWTSGKNTGTAVSYLVRFDNGTPITVTGPPVAAPPGLGAHTFTVTAQDAAGNLSKPVTQAYWWDTTPPVAPQITGPSDLSVLNTTSATVSWTGGGDDDSGLLGYRLTVNGTTLPKLVSASATTAKVALRAGSNTVAVAAVNSVGASTASTPVTVTVDAKAPASATRLVLSSGALTWTAAKDIGTPIAFTVSLNGTPVTSTNGTSLAVATPAGRHTWTVVARDAAGNQSRPTNLIVGR
jgi:hypothetical protein